MVPTVGRIVLVNIGRRPSDSEDRIRPAMVVRVWSPTCINAQVFVDGANDQGCSGLYDNPCAGPVWKTSLTQGDGPGQWNWMPYQVAHAAKDAAAS